MSEPFTTDFGYLTNTPAALAAVRGIYLFPPDMDRFLVELLGVMATPARLKNKGLLNILVSEADNKLAWMKQKEMTAGKPSCLSFAHYKSASADPTLNAANTLLRNVPLLVGFSPSSWQTITDVKILKKPNQYRVAKMQLIQLLPPVFQMNNKMIGRKILAHAEECNAVSPDQHSSRKNHKSIYTCLNKKLTCDIFQQK